MEERSYRQSRLCRLLGNPVAFAVVQLLAENKQMSPGDIARAVGRSVQRVSTVLAALRPFVETADVSTFPEFRKYGSSSHSLNPDSGDDPEGALPGEYRQNSLAEHPALSEFIGSP